MTNIIKNVHRAIIRPATQTLVLAGTFHYLVWTKYFDAAWETTPLHEKLTWLMLLANTLSILTILEIIAFKI